MNFIPRFLPCNTECKQGTSALRSFVRSAPLRYLIFQNSELVELPARGTRRSFALALVGLTRLFGVEPALFAPADAAMGPQSLENHFGCGCGGDRKSQRLNSSHGYISYAGFCLKQKII